MVLVPAGGFSMGSTDADIDAAVAECGGCQAEWFADEKPQHEVFLDAFWIDRTEVTNAQYAAFLNERGNQTERGVQWMILEDEGCLIERVGEQYRPKPGYESHPAVLVTWFGARAYCEWAGKRLPSEAEWEKAARGTDRRVYPWGREFDCRLGNFDDETQRQSYVVPGGPNCDGYDRIAPVGSYPDGASPYGALDMAGNVWEWTLSIYSGYPYNPRDGREDATAGDARVLRGGAWYALVGGRARCASRVSRGHDFSGVSLGLRCVSSVLDGD
jgi:formylglycine-generating enzyme required for sulfatase activity